MSTLQLPTLVKHFADTHTWRYVPRRMNHVVYRRSLRDKYILDLHNEVYEGSAVKIGEIAFTMLDVRPTHFITTTVLNNRQMLTLRAFVQYRPSYLQFTLSMEVDDNKAVKLITERCLTYAHVLVAMDIMLDESVKKIQAVSA